MPSIDASRRRFLAGVAAAGTAALAGCPLGGSTRYSLESRPEDGTGPVELFRWEPAHNAFHYEEADAERKAEELRETGRVRSVGIPLVGDRGTGEAGYRPSYAAVDGTYHRVRVEATPVELERWVVWMEPLESLPDGVDYTTTPREGRSELDERILDRAIDDAVVSELEERDHAALPATRRGTVFFDPLDPGESDLVPEPPFEYALVEPDSEFGPDELALRLHVGRESVETTRYRHELEAVADDRAAFVDHVEDEHVAASFEADALSEEQIRVLEESRSLTGYDEDAPPSEAFGTVLEALDLADVSLPDGREVASWLRFYALEGDYYEAELMVSDTSLVDVEIGNGAARSGSGSGVGDLAGRGPAGT